MLEKEITKFATDINDLINANYNTYKDISRIKADFRTEKGTTKSYNGRQLLEMLQNADDARTDVVDINLDRQNNRLSISNNGTPFTVEEGIASLMVASTSSKKKEFIGNKGLGFRSILNWVSEVKIITQKEVVVFSEKIAKEEFEKLSKSSQDKLILENKDRLSENEVPFAILAIPRVYINEETSNFETTIELNYKKEEEFNIIEQLNFLAPEILLFLNHTSSISITDSENELTKNISRTTNESNTRITINNITWNIKNSGEVFYKEVKDEKQYFSYKIAWQDNLGDVDSKLFTHFPTKEYTYLPFLIHATFDLDPSRNYLNSSIENEDLLAIIADALGEIAENKIRKEKSDWDAYQFMLPERISNDKQLAEFHSRIEELRDELEIYPCVDGTYCKLEDAIFYGSAFSDWVIRNNVQEQFSNLLIPNKLDFEIYVGKEYTFEGWLEIFNNVTHQITNLQERALLIKLLMGNSFKTIHNSKVKLPLLLDTKDGVIPETSQAFILSKADIEQYIIPSYVDISFMSGELYEELLSVLEEEVSNKWNGQEHKSRPLKRVIAEVVNIGSNDITDVIRNIVTTSDKEIKLAEDEKINDIAIGLVESLFSIYQVNPERRNSINLNIPLLNKNLDLCIAGDLYLGEDYELGKTTSIIFKGIFEDKDYVAGNEFWQLEEGGYEYLENFFGWLGVNRLTKTNTKPKYLNRDQIDNYSNFVFRNTSWPDSKVHKEYNVIQISDFERISNHKNFSLEILIAWLISDVKLFNQLNFDNQDTFSYSYHNKVTPVNFKPSFIYYQIKELYLKNIDSKFIKELDFAKDLGYNSIDFDHPVFKELQVDEVDIDKVLKILDLNLSIYDIEPEEIYNIIEQFPEKDLEGKYARKLYNLVFSYFKTKKEIDFSEYEKNYKLFAKRKSQKEYKLIDEVYYSDNSTLPSKIADEFWMIDLPKRLGESQISRYFGVKTFKDIEIKIDKDSIKESVISPDFQSWFTKIKPYILTYRLRSINNSIQKAEAEELKKAEISIVSSLSYSIKVGEEKQLLPGEFLPKPNGRGYYLGVKENVLLEDLKDNPKVCEAFAEILCTVFKVNDHKDDYRAVFKDRNTLTDTKYLIDVKSLNELYKTVLELLGISNEEINFWSKIYDYNGLVLASTIKDSKELSQVVLEDFGFDMVKQNFGVDYQILDTEKSVAFLREINSKLGVPISQLFDSDSDGLVNYHLLNFETTVLDYKKYFNSCLWSALNEVSSKHKLLINSQEKYENFIKSIEVRDMLFEYRFELNLNYIQILKEEVDKVFGFKLIEEEKNKITIQTDYLKLLKENNISDNEIEDDKIRSLLYFPGNVEKIKAYIVSNKESENSESENDNSEKVIGKLIFSSSKKVIHKQPKNSEGRGGTWNHTDKDIKRNKRAGKKAEELTYNTLLESDEVAEVEWVSSFSNTSDKSDNKHYDIRYKPMDSNSWKYLEVKSFNGSYFHLSRSEKQEALKRGKDFEIALVIGEEVHIQRGLFTSDVDFENNDMFYAMPSDYIITLKID
ncbi:sacsin N-terminal ATP-binding-like domain-containing protein [Polaribacter sp. M15]